MSKKRIISESLNIRINVGNYQHIEITKQAQEEISYDTEEERIELEQALSNDLIIGVIKSMKTIPAKLGKGIENAQEVEEAIAKAIPEWLDKANVPNIANVPKDHSDKVALEQKNNKDQAAQSTSDVLLDAEVPEVTNEVETVPTEVEEDIFAEDEPPAKSEVIEEVASVTEDVKTEVKTEAVVEPAKEPEVKQTQTTSDDFDDFFDEDDLFED